MAEIAVSYDPAILRRHALNLYRLAERITTTCRIVGALIGGAVAYFAARASSVNALVPALAGFLLGALLGHLYGVARTFALKVEAQRTLCQVQIEENTRAR